MQREDRKGNKFECNMPSRKIAIYVRQSIIKEDSISLDTQKEICLEKEGHPKNYKVYSDQKSGKDTNRPGFQKMMADIEDGFIGEVIVYKLDRISRSVLDFCQMIEVFKKYDVSFKSATEAIDTSTDQGAAMVMFLMVFAELERKTIRSRILDNYYARAKDGFYLGGKPPYGYAKEETRIGNKKTYYYVENPVESEIVKYIFQEYAQNINSSFGSISKTLNENNVSFTSDNSWNNVTVSRIIRNPAFTFATAEVYQYLKDKGFVINNSVDEFIGVTGLYRYTEGGHSGKRDPNNPALSYISIAPHTPFIPADIWLACNRRADNNKQIKNTGNGKYSWLSGLCKCGYCGLSLQVAKRNTKYHKLACSGKRNHSCTGISLDISVVEIEEYVEKVLLNHLKTELIKCVNVTPESSVEYQKINAIDIQIVKLDEKINNLINSLAERGAAVRKKITEQLDKLEQEREKLEKEKTELQGANKQILSAEKIEEVLRDWPEFSFERKKEIAKTFIKSIVITDSEINITLN